jgi:SAM-dependent methyltransferase
VHVELILKKFIPARYYPQAERIYFNWRGLRYLGFRLTCPCCNGHFRKFLPFGVKPIPNVLCPRCYSQERHRLLQIYLKSRTNFFKDSLKVLDIAPTQFFREKCKSLPNLDYLSADISSPLAMLRMDITRISLTDNQFDCVICYHVLEHIPDDQKAMRELFRVLKPGGWAILQSPIDFNQDKTFEDPSIVSPDERERFFGQNDHVRIYGRDYKDRLEKAGFVVKVDDYVQQLGDSAIKKYGLMRDEKIHFCSKPK